MSIMLFVKVKFVSINWKSKCILVTFPTLGYTQEYFPVNALTNEGPYEFQISSAGESYMYLPMTRLQGSFKIMKVDGGVLKDCVAGDDYSVTNNFVSNLFSKLEVSVNGTEVVDQSLS